VAQTITLYISDADTTAFDFDTAVFSLELEAPNGDVTELFAGKIKVTGEATTTET
jgi:hypothetical protein